MTCAFFLSNGLTRLTTSYDLSAQQICQLAKRLGPERAARLEAGGRLKNGGRAGELRREELGQSIEEWQVGSHVEKLL